MYGKLSNKEKESLNKIIEEVQKHLFPEELEQQLKALEAKLAIAREALELIAGPVEFYCEVGERNKQAAAEQALEKIGGV